ncbi:hypothetical protein DL89DRAFT_270671 [Linderina pennispora]|uniref:G-protein coupled receptors family 3 profile domain-containing protein n=1 Tax=Linderina pennispora TaxID=61395 RepID=A0A1Y1VWR3_9FUNG|nr:uncharacterized protein DL89DRAFT_270671 [Linderina pennispora]ORX65722.1 hypothetical protein DL89DRAFT_270671 [Linderina pennispora]
MHPPHTNLLASRAVSDTDKVEIATLLGYQLELVGPSDYVVIAVGAVLNILTVLLIIFAWLNQTYRPIRAKNLRLTTLMCCACVLWYFGDLATNGHVRLTGKWRLCKLWSIWCRDASVFTYSALMFIRIYALDRVFNKHKSYTGWAYYGPIWALFIIIIAFSVTVQWLDDSVTVAFIETIEICKFGVAFRYANMGLLAIIWIAIAVAMFKIRNIESSFREVRECVIICVLALYLLVATTVVQVCAPDYALKRGLRAYVTFSDLLVSHACLWIILGQPVYMRVFRKDYEHRWLQRLTRDGFENEYDVAPLSFATTKLDSDSDDGMSSIHGSSYDGGSTIYSSSASEYPLPDLNIGAPSDAFQHINLDEKPLPPIPPPTPAAISNFTRSNEISTKFTFTRSLQHFS